MAVSSTKQMTNILNSSSFTSITTYSETENMVRLPEGPGGGGEGLNTTARKTRKAIWLKLTNITLKS